MGKPEQQLIALMNTHLNPSQMMRRRTSLRDSQPGSSESGDDSSDNKSLPLEEMPKREGRGSTD